MTQVAQMSEPQGRQILGRISRSKPGKIAVGKGQNHDVARRLTEVARLDDVVESR